MSAQKKWVAAKRDSAFCPGGLRWARRFKTVRRAWAACDRPSWMLYWVRLYCGVDWAAMNHQFGPQLGGALFSSPRVSKALCDEIRRTYTYTGKRRKVSA